VLEVPGVVNMELIHRSFPRKGGVAVIWTHGAKTSREKKPARIMFDWKALRKRKENAGGKN